MNKQQTVYDDEFIVRSPESLTEYNNEFIK